MGTAKALAQTERRCIFQAEKKRKRRKMINGTKSKVSPCAQTVPALAIAAADVGESARLDALPHFFFFYGLLRRLGEDLITVLCVCSP